MTLSQKKHWVEITLPVDGETEEWVSQFLFELGSLGCHTEKGILHGYFSQHDWREDKADELRRYLLELQRRGLRVEIEKMKVRVFADRDWNEEWKKGYRPFEIGGRFLIKPSWYESVAAEDKTVIEIDPQMAFGTGTHATTRLVLELMLKQSGDFHRILDIGTGTGILSIAAANLFSGKIIAFDNDPIAVTTARDNAVKNGVGDRIDFFCSTTVSLLPMNFDLIMANIHRTVLEKMLIDIRQHLSSQGRVIFSGVLIEEREKFLKSLSLAGFAVREEKAIDEWLGIIVGKEF